MHKSATKCNEIIGKWCKNKHGASKIIDTFETCQLSMENRTRGVKRWDEGCGVESWTGVDKTWVCGSF
jgi:hypothetical protein